MKKYANKKLDNKGAALVMAILVIAFVSILTTILLYLANMNYQMKATDFKTKDAFYNSEIPLETIRTRLVMDVAEASADAYDASVLNYANVDNSVRASEYQSTFYNSIIEVWEKRCENPGTGAKWDWVYAFGNLFDNTEAEAITPLDKSDIHILKSTDWTDTGCNTTGCARPYHLILDNNYVDSQRLIVETDPTTHENKLKLFGVKLVFTKDNFTSIIETNYNIVPPKVKLNVDNYVDDTPTEAVKREDVNFETCVTYVGYKKQ